MMHTLVYGFLILNYQECTIFPFYIFSLFGNFSVYKSNPINLLGDKRTQWQVCEGLGAVSFNQNNIKKAVEYFQKALTLVASSEPLNTAAQNRIVAKITLAVQAQVKKESAAVVRKVCSLFSWLL